VSSYPVSVNQNNCCTFIQKGKRASQIRAPSQHKNLAQAIRHVSKSINCKKFALKRPIHAATFQKIHQSGNFETGQKLTSFAKFCCVSDGGSRISPAVDRNRSAAPGTLRRRFRSSTSCDAMKKCSSLCCPTMDSMHSVAGTGVSCVQRAMSSVRAALELSAKEGMLRRL
jgi:hypothetical protein